MRSLGQKVQSVGMRFEVAYASHGVACQDWVDSKIGRAAGNALHMIAVVAATYH